MNKNEFYRLIQIPEIKKEFEENKINEKKIVKLLRELFEDLSVETTAISCVEIDQLCTDLVVSGLINSLPWVVQDIIEDCMTLHDFPSEYSLHSPIELLNKINAIYDKLYDDGEIITTKDRIISMYKKYNDVNEVSKKININKQTVERQIIIAKKLDQI